MRKQNGFTLIELLVVIAIIALLLGVLVPALNYAKVQATAIICMSNLDGLTMGWVLYNEDNDQKVMGSRPHGANARSVEYYPAYPRGSATREVWNFVGNPHDENGNDGNHGIEYAARGFRNGALWPYVESERSSIANRTNVISKSLQKKQGIGRTAPGVVIVLIRSAVSGTSTLQKAGTPEKSGPSFTRWMRLYRPATRWSFWKSTIHAA